ncbi:MAG: superoxide dismutase family protein [Xanthobacteraceae bacterium]
MNRKFACAALGAALIAGVAHAQEKSADVVGAKGDKIGAVAIKQGPHGSIITIALGKGALTPGVHGVHIHEHGDCSDAGQFTKSKGHVNPGGKEHGFLNPKGPHPGDVPNIYAHADGSSQTEMLVYGVTLSGGKLDLIDEDGSAIIIHANADDHLSQPIGGAGARVACALIE